MIWMSVRDVSHLAHIPLRTLQRWVTEGHVTSRRKGRRGTEVDIDEVVTFANRRAGLTEPDHGA